MKRFSREITVAAALLILFVALSVFAPNFFDFQPFVSRMASQMPALVLAMGVALVIITRQIDISIGSQFGMCAVIAGTAAASGMPMPIAMACAILAGLVMGVMNGWLVAGLQLPSIVVTLATMVIWQEVLRLWQKGRLLALPEGIQWFGVSQSAGQITVISAAFLLLLMVAGGMKYLAVGRRIHAVGSNADAARLAGLAPRIMTFGVFVNMGVFAGLAAVLNLVQSPQIQPNCGDGLELKAIAAAVVGGVAITGGRGTLFGVLLGMMLLANVNPALTHFHQPPYWEKAIQGLVILIAVAADRSRLRKQKSIL
jgi:rhamnose transport system permease protein